MTNLQYKDINHPYFAANNAMQITGKLLQLLPLQTGQGKNGNWKKQDIILETEGQYPKKVCISIWGDKADEKILQVGNSLKIDFDIESREYSGRWYTDVKAWKVESAGASNNTAGNDTYFDAPSPDVPADTDLPF